MLDKDNKENIAAALKRYRLEREWTLEQVANAVRLSASTIQKIENGTHCPHELTMYKLKKYLPGFMDSDQRP